MIAVAGAGAIACVLAWRKRNTARAGGEGRRRKQGERRWLVACGLMSGTSLDAVDAAVVYTDGETVFRLGPVAEVAISPQLRQRVRDVQAQFRADLAAGVPKGSLLARTMTDYNCGLPISEPSVAAIERDLTDLHAVAVSRVRAMLSDQHIDVIGFHGQTMIHSPRDPHKLTCQLGDGRRLAGACASTVVYRFRDADVASGGEGAPLAPAYHMALLRQHAESMRQSGKETSVLGVLNIGGVSNVTLWRAATDDLCAFDCGPGNALIDDFVMLRTGAPCDIDGRLAAAGERDQLLDESLMAIPSVSEFVYRRAPKSCDRDAFVPALEAVSKLAMNDASAALALTRLTAWCIVASMGGVPAGWGPPSLLVVTGGGRRNPTLMRELRRAFGDSSPGATQVVTAEDIGWRGDSLEAEAFAYLAVRSTSCLPISWPGTTAVTAPLTGGVSVQPGEAHTDL